MDEPKSHWIPCEKPHNIPAKGLTPKMVAAELQGICAERAAAAHAKLSRPSPSLNDIYALYWAHNRDVADPATLLEALVALELDAEAALAAAVTPDNKRALIDKTTELVERGAFGLPVCFVEEQMFFGNDRLTLLEATYPDGTPSARLIAPMTK